MVEGEHVARLKQGVEAWNAWRRDGSCARPNLRGADLQQTDLVGADLSAADLCHAPQKLPAVRSKLFGIQRWVALSAKDEETSPDFVHYDASEMPVLTDEGKTVRVIAGSILGASSPVRTSSPMFYADVALQAGASVPLDPDHDERAIYTVSGEIEISGDVFGPAQLLVFRPGDRISIRARTDARLMLLGGEPMDGPRIIWWNFVSSRLDRIEQAKADWKAARFDSVPGDSEFIPLPEPEPPPVRCP